ncbi:MAG: hypothetical protein ACXV3D_08610 [Halobacteriota archaeon]
MAQSFQDLKRTSGQRLDFLRSIIRPNLGSHKQTKLTSAGCDESGSLLHNNVAKLHAELLKRDYQKRLGGLTRGAAQERLRFLTILHTVTSLSQKNVIRAVGKMEAALHRVFDRSGAWLLGAVEVEVVNISLLRRIGSLSEDETRKLNVLEKISAEETGSERGILVHFHGVVDLGRNSLLHEEQLRQKLKKIPVWRKSPYQIELKRLFKERTVERNLRDISSYITKGGNDQLRYNAGFGRDLVDDLDAKMWRAGEGRADQGADTVTDERGLAIGEIKFLDDIWCTLMARKRNKRGYLVRLG